MERLTEPMPPPHQKDMESFVYEVLRTEKVEESRNKYSVLSKMADCSPPA